MRPCENRAQVIYGISGSAGTGFLKEITIVNGQCTVSTVGPLVDVVSGLPLLFHNLAICPDGILYAQGAGFLYTINPNNGLCTPLFSTNVFNINGLVCSPDNILYGIGNNPLPHSLIEIDPASFSSTNLGPVNFWAGSDLVFFNGQLYCVSDDGLFIVNIGNPQASTFVFHSGVYPALTVLPGYCNSLLGSDLDGQFFQINPDTQEETLLCSPGQYMFDFASIAEFDPATQCPFIIDLDEDNSSGADEYDFNGPFYNCNTSDGIPICDQDVKITSDIKILSITISLEEGVLDGLEEYLKFEGNVPFVNVSGSGSQSITLTNTGNATTTSFENALKSILYYNDADPLSPGQRKIKVTGITITGTPSNEAFAFLEVQDLTKLDIDLGPDTTLCQGLTYLLDAYYPGASYQWNTGETTSFTFVTEPGIYVVTVSHPNRCPGFDEVAVDFIPTKLTSLVIPALVCAGDSVDIKINSQLSQPFDIELISSTGTAWSYNGITSGHHFKIKANQNQLINIVNIATTETPCALSESASYPITVSPRDTTRLNYSFCEGDSIYILNQWYFTSDTLQQKLKNKSGCDSLIFSFLKRIDRDTILTLQYTCIASEAGTTFSNTQNAEGCLLVNQTETILLLPDTTWINSTTCILTEAGTFQSNFTNLAGCDSTVIVDNKYVPADTTAITLYSCFPSEVGTKIYVLSNQFGCDSTLVETTYLRLADTTTIQKYTCVAGEAGTFSNTYQNMNGCDSVVIEENIWVATDTSELVEFTCLASNIGLDTFYFQSQYGCDSIVVFKRIYQPPDTTFATKLSCNPAETGIYIHTGISANGCDSIHKLLVLLSPPDTTYQTRQSCDLSEAGIFESTFVNNLGCDSFTRLTVVYVPPDTTYLTKTSCIQSETGVFNHTLSNVYGCDSLVISEVRLLKSDTVHIQKFTCNAHEAGLFTRRFVNQYGCDSIIYEDIRWAGSDTLFISENKCHISKDTTFLFSLINQWGCDSIVRVQWIARYDDHTTMFDTVCLIQDTTSTFLYLKNIYGCDSIVKQRHIYKGDFTVLPVIFTCDSIAGDSIYYYLSNIIGCDSVVVQPYLRKPEDQCRKAYNLILPNIIDPNIDGQSNFQIATLENIYILDFRIYDRWGNLIYHSTDEEIQNHKGWDGSLNGSQVVPGVYVYYIKVRWDGYEFTYTGDVTVVR